MPAAVTSTTELHSGAAETDVHLAYLRSTIARLTEVVEEDRMPILNYVSEVSSALSTRIETTVSDARRDRQQMSEISLERHQANVHSLELFKNSIELLKTGFQDRFTVLLEDARRDNHQISAVSLERHKTAMEALLILRGDVLNQFSQFKEHLDERFKVIDKNTDLARESIAQKFEGVNEFRGQLKDQAATLITRAEVMTLVTGINERLGKLENTMANYDGRMLMIGLLAAALPTIVTVLLHFLR